MNPLLMPPNVIDHFYRGGERIAELRGLGLPADGRALRRPEEWLAATTDRAGHPGIGPSRTVDGTLLRDLIAADPVGWLGAAASLGDSGLLVKLLDAGQRLPVHVHPDRSFAAAHLGCPYGKTEAWFVLAVSGENPSVWLGFTEDVDPGELAARMDAQDSDWMLGHLHRIQVRPGDGILVPAGTAHAIGPGVFVAEVQEPTDLSILLEWSITTATRDESHLELGFPVALQALNHQALSADRLAGLVRHTDPEARAGRLQRLLPEEADPFFRLHQLAPDSTADSAPDSTARTAGDVAAGFAVVVGLAGSGEAIGTEQAVTVRRGQVLAVPAGFGPWRVTGDVRLLVARPGSGWPDTLAQTSERR